MIRTFSRPASPARRITASRSAEVPIEPTAVMPKDEQDSPAPCASASSRLRRRAGRDRALDQASRVVDEEAGRVAAASRSILPPSGAWVAAVIPASCIAALLPTPAWPSTRSSTTGRSLTTASRSAAVGKRLVGPQFLVPAEADDPRGCRLGRRHRRRSRCCMSASELVPTRSSVSAPTPSSMTWPWASISPGSSVRPRAVDRTRVRVRPPVAALVEHLPHLAVVADQQAAEMLQLAVGADLDAVDVVDQRVGERGGGGKQLRRARGVS